MFSIALLQSTEQIIAARAINIWLLRNHANAALSQFSQFTNIDSFQGKRLESRL